MAVSRLTLLNYLAKSASQQTFLSLFHVLPYSFHLFLSCKHSDHQPFEAIEYVQIFIDIVLQTHL